MSSDHHNTIVAASDEPNWLKPAACVDLCDRLITFTALLVAMIAIAIPILAVLGWACWRAFR